MPLFKKKQPERIPEPTMIENSSVGRLMIPPLEMPKPMTLQEQIALTTELDFKAQLITDLAQIKEQNKEIKELIKNAMANT